MTLSRFLLFLLAAFSLAPIGASGQGAPGLEGREALRQRHPGLRDLVVRVERAHGVLLYELAEEGNAVRARQDRRRTAGFESDLVDRLSAMVRREGTADDEARRSEAGYAGLGPRGADILRWGRAFQREVLSILSDPTHADPAAALREAVTLYEGRPAAALPSVPKNMDVLYGHPYALGFRTMYPDLDGFVWAGHWLRLAVTEPMTDLPVGPERNAGIDTVTARYFAKLTYAAPPRSVPTELPLAPAIAPGLIWLSPKAAMIWDNLSMLEEVLGDVLASPETSDVAGAIEATLDFFQDPELAVTDQDEWEIMALRHGIFFQGGFPLAVMTESERNTGGHAAHLAGGAMLMTIPGMPRR